MSQPETQTQTTRADGGGETRAAIATAEDHLRSFASNCRIQGARVRLDLTEAPRIGSGSYDAEVTRRIGEAVDAALAAPAAKGGTIPAGWKLVPEEPSEEMIASYLPEVHRAEQEGIVRAIYRAMLAAAPTPPAGAAGGGSGDLAALSAGATPGEWVAKETCWFRTSILAGSDFVVRAGKYSQSERYGVEKSKDAEFIVALVNAYRSGRLIEAPTPDLGAQGEPVAWAYEELRTRTFDEWEPALSYDRPGPASWFRNVEPLFKQAPAAPRSGSAVTKEQIAAVLRSMFALDPQRVSEAAEKILALLQDPRPGETGDGWEPIETVPEGEEVLVDGGLGLMSTTPLGRRVAVVDDRADLYATGSSQMLRRSSPTRWHRLPAPAQAHDARSEGGE